MARIVDNEYWTQRSQGEELFPKLAKPFDVNSYLDELVKLERINVNQVPSIKTVCAELTQEFLQGGMFISNPSQVVDLSGFRGPIQELIETQRAPSHAHIPELQVFQYGELKNLLVQAKRRDLAESIEANLNGNGMSLDSKVYIFSGELAAGSYLDRKRPELTIVPPEPAARSFDGFISTAGRILEAKFGRRINKPTGVSFKSLAQISFVGAMRSAPTIRNGLR